MARGFSIWFLHLTLGEHPDDFTVGGDELVHLGGDEVVSGLVGVGFQLFHAL